MSDVSPIAARTTLRFDAEQRVGIAAYMAETGFTQSQAIRTLIEIGLAREEHADRARARAAIREGFNSGIRLVKETLANALGDHSFEGVEIP